MEEGLGFPKTEYDGVTNQFYNPAEHRELLDRRVDEFNKLRGEGRFSKARPLLTEGKLADRFSAEELKEFFDEVANFWVGKSGQSGADRPSYLLVAATEYGYLVGLLVERWAKKMDSKELDAEVTTAQEKEKELAKNAFESFKGAGEPEDALRIVESFRLDPSLGKEVAPKVIRKLLRARTDKERKRRDALELADRYNVEDEDILEELTK